MIRVVVALLLLVWPAVAQEAVPSHGITILGKPALPADFDHFPYVNPDAPKGGEVVFGTQGSFDGFNPYILRGNAALGLGRWQPGVGGTESGAAGSHVWESLLVPSADEIATAYCHLCSTVAVAADRLSAAFELRPEARFADGTPVLAEDVVWTFDTLMEKGRPSIKVQYAEVADAVAEGPRRVVFHFKSSVNRELPLMVGGLPVMPKHWWATRDFTRPLAEPPLGSGPYKVAAFELGRNVVYERDPTWWARDRPTGKGLFNFDRVRVEYYRDPTVLFEAFKAGQVDWRQENSSKNWATAYDFDAVKAGLAKKEAIPHSLPIGIQGWVFNTRRPQFRDARVREALGVVFDFEWLNKNLFYGQYARSRSYFGDTEGEAKGVPGAGEVALLEPFRAGEPASVFDRATEMPVTDGSGNNREGLRRALGLLRDAGWTVKDRKLVGPDGTAMTFTILLNDPGLERVALPYQGWLKQLGADVNVRIVDPAQFERLTDAFDFDVTTIIYPGSELPGNELRDYYSCAGAKVEGSANVSGVCDKAADALIEAAVNAGDREALFTAVRALDRVLVNGWYLVPQYHDTVFKVSSWNRFGRPAGAIRTGFVLDAWWVDAALAARTDAARRAGR